MSIEFPYHRNSLLLCTYDRYVINIAINIGMNFTTFMCSSSLHICKNFTITGAENGSMGTITKHIEFPANGGSDSIGVNICFMGCIFFLVVTTSAYCVWISGFFCGDLFNFMRSWEIG